MYYLNSSPLVAGLVHRVIVQSAGFCPTTLERSVGAAEWLLASLGVPDTASPAEQARKLRPDLHRRGRRSSVRLNFRCTSGRRHSAYQKTFRTVVVPEYPVDQ